MGHIIKQNNAILFDIFITMITSFNGKLIGAEYGSWERYKFCLGLVYTLIMFFASINGWEGLKFYFNKLVENISRRDYGEQGM